MEKFVPFKLKISARITCLSNIDGIVLAIEAYIIYNFLTVIYIPYLGFNIIMDGK